MLESVSEVSYVNRAVFRSSTPNKIRFAWRPPTVDLGSHAWSGDVRAAAEMKVSAVFDVPGHLVDATGESRKEPLKHEPSDFLGDIRITGDFIGTGTPFLQLPNRHNCRKPNCREPIAESSKNRTTFTLNVRQSRQVHMRASRNERRLTPDTRH